jgi:mRNA interferase RelE/StbE
LAWTIELLDGAKRSLAKLDHQTARRIRNYLARHVAPLDDPRSVGHALTGPRRGYWRYRVGDYRIICSIEHERIVIVVVEIGHRSDIYR